MNTKRKFRIDHDAVFDTVNITIMVLLFVIFSWPLWFVVIASVSDPNAVWNGDVLLLPKGINFDGYKKILEQRDIWVGFRNSIFYTAAGTVINLLCTILAAYPLSRKDFMLNKFFTKMFMFTMYFSGGMIPTYLVVNSLKMVDTVWAMLIPCAISFHNVLICRTYFHDSIPDGLEEAAELDGATTWKYLWKIVIPLSKPVLAVLALYYGMAHWNNFFNALIYMNDSEKFPLQLVLRSILINNTFNNDLMEGLDPQELEAMAKLGEVMKYGIIIVATIPAMCVYPFVQKHFVKGVMIGAVKG